MAKSLEKMHKKIAAKKKGNLGSLHEGSRDSRKLRKALLRDGRLQQLQTARRKQEQPMRERAGFFLNVLAEKEFRPLTADEVQEAVKSFVHQYDEELTVAKSERRPGRPASVREDTLVLMQSKLEKEFTDGFFVPDLASEETVSAMKSWEEGRIPQWAQLTGLNWVRVTSQGGVRTAQFPPTK